MQAQTGQKGDPGAGWISKASGGSLLERVLVVETSTEMRPSDKETSPLLKRWGPRDHGEQGRKLDCLRKVHTPNRTAAMATRPSGPSRRSPLHSAMTWGRVRGGAGEGICDEMLAAPRRMVATAGLENCDESPPLAEI